MDVRSASRRVLMLARHFPPLGGAGVHRSVGYTRYLPAYGYRPLVVTGPGRSDDRWSPQDPGLLSWIPPRTAIHRLEGPEPAGYNGFRGRTQRWLQRPEPWVRWWVEQAYAKGLEVGGDADLILASCVPYDTAEAGARLARELGKPWIADLEDPWALDEMRVHPTALHQRLDFARMRRALATAAAIVMSAPEAAEKVRAAMPEQADKIVAGIPIGFDPQSFNGSPPAPPRRDAIFRIVHTGSLHTQLGEAHRRTLPLRRLMRGTSLDVDILTRSAVFLLEAIERLIEDDPELADRVELHLAGGLTARDRVIAEGHPFVRLHGQLAHNETVALMRSADLLFLPMHDLPPGTRAGLIPYKTYEYLATRRPILAAVPDGDARDLLAPLAHVSVCRPSDVAGMARAIHAWIERAPMSDGPACLESPALGGLDRRQVVGRIASLFDEVLGVGDGEGRAAAT